jgi:hypothetical protein
MRIDRARDRTLDRDRFRISDRLDLPTERSRARLRSRTREVPVGRDRKAGGGCWFCSSDSRASAERVTAITKPPKKWHARQVPPLHETDLEFVALLVGHGHVKWVQETDSNRRSRFSGVMSQTSCRCSILQQSGWLGRYRAAVDRLSADCSAFELQASEWSQSV